MLNSKNRAKLSSDKSKRLNELDKKKGKGKTSGMRKLIPCPLLPNVPAIPPPKIPQPGELQRCQETIAEVSAPEQQAVEDTLVSIPEMNTIVEDSGSEEDYIVGWPPRETGKAPNKRMNIQSSPPAGIIQMPANTQDCEIELLGFSSQASTSGTVPVLNMDSMYCEMDVDTEPGSESEDDDRITYNPRNVFEYMQGEDLEDSNLAEDIQRIGAEEDASLRTIADNDDLLYFDWLGNSDNFTGVRETFTGSPGPTFDVTGLTPLEVFAKIWDADIIDHIVRETNRYAQQVLVKALQKNESRMSRWKDTTREEIWQFLSIIMLQSLVINNVEREYWYPRSLQLKLGDFGKIIPYNRFMLLKRCLHFVDNASLRENPSKLDKIMPIIELLNDRFSSLYLPEQNVAIDESLLLWKGRLSFAQLIATKRARVGIKSYELCESRTGYLWKMNVYSGKGHIHAPQEAVDAQYLQDESESATSQIIYNLMRPLFGKGHTIIMDNFYNAPLLSRLLKSRHKTDSMGTLRLNREFVPETLKCKNKNNMRAGEVCYSTTKDLCVVVWKDKSVVTLISTFHPPQVGGKEKYGYYRYKPQVVLDYNLSMGGVDHKDQMLHAFPVERVRNLVWYKKLFRRLVNVSIHNALVICNHGRTKQTQFGNRDFRLQLAEEIMQMYSPQALIQRELPPPTTLSNMHLPERLLKKQRCKYCYKSTLHPQRTTMWKCTTCNINLCIGDCYTGYHAKYVSK